ncbi:hypothetical protein [Spirillospora sp. CA-294931]|uniref:hypothetical protein n=1 Tax=Spirillospora sp. CA-294931 TaxID=3240042 RepID=UPI003D8B0619
MWPNAPTGPPPPRPRVRPHGAWYALPAVIGVVAVVGFLIMLLTNIGASNAADRPPATGDPETGISLDVTGGHKYLIYARQSDSAPSSCSLSTDGGPAEPVTLSKKSPLSAPDHKSYRYVVSFEAPESGTIKLTCRGADGQLLVRPDDTAHVVLGLSVLGALAGVALAAAITLTLALMRRASKQRVRASGHYGPRLY